MKKRIKFSKPIFLKSKRPSSVRIGDVFDLAGMMWRVETVKKEGLSTAFTANVFICPAGYTDCALKLDIHAANTIKWHRRIRRKKLTKKKMKQWLKDRLHPFNP